jgi:hypothetical protein
MPSAAPRQWDGDQIVGNRLEPHLLRSSFYDADGIHRCIGYRSADATQGPPLYAFRLIKLLGNTVKPNVQRVWLRCRESSLSVWPTAKEKGSSLKTMQAYKRSPALENSTWYKGLLISQLAGSSDTDGAFDLVESRMTKGTEPPPHIHDQEDELFLCLGVLAAQWIATSPIWTEAVNPLGRLRRC